MPLGIILSIINDLKEKDNFRRYAFIIAIIGLIINGFLVMIDIGALFH